ncbi:MAG: hypothetical protein ACFBQW_02480 [Sphingomonadaceae bacterium]
MTSKSDQQEKKKRPVKTAAVIGGVAAAALAAAMFAPRVVKRKKPKGPVNPVMQQALTASEMSGPRADEIEEIEIGKAEGKRR